MDLDAITGEIVDASMRIHRRFGPGLLESFYEALLVRELHRTRLRTERQRLITFSYDGVEVEDAFRADIIVEGCVIVEVKSQERFAPVHSRQVLTYLRLLDLRVGLLLNFGEERMKDGIKRVVNNFPTSPDSLLRVNRPHSRQSSAPPQPPAPPRGNAGETKPARRRPQRSAQLFTMLWHWRQRSLQFRHQRSVDPQTSHTSGSGSLGAVML
jgi:iron complex transport system substrate-binding protein